jgi:hypothetical protein
MLKRQSKKTLRKKRNVNVRAGFPLNQTLITVARVAGLFFYLLYDYPCRLLSFLENSQGSQRRVCKVLAYSKLEINGLMYHLALFNVGNHLNF